MEGQLVTEREGGAVQTHQLESLCLSWGEESGRGRAQEGCLSGSPSIMREDQGVRVSPATGMRRVRMESSLGQD